jgi:Mn2+/Fe2+ NRAMP family transporter
VLPLTTSYAICEAFGWERGEEATFRTAPVYKGLITAIIVISGAVIVIPGIDLMNVMLTSQLVNGILLPVLLIFLVLLANKRHIMGAFKNGKFANVLTVATIVVILVLTAILFVMQIMPS